MSTPFSKAPIAAALFEQLEKRSMMAAHPAQHEAAPAGEYDAALRSPMMKSESQLAAPQLTARALSPDQVRLKWTAVDGATSYRIERFIGTNREWRDIGQTSKTTATSYKLRGNRLYRYHVVAIDAEGRETASEIVSVRPNAALAHAAHRAEKIVNMVEAFRAQQTELVAANVDRAEDMDFRRQIRRAQRNFSQQMLDMGVSYRPVSVEALMPATTPGFPQLNTTPPPTLTVTTRSSSELAVNWNAVTGAMAYKIERSADSGTTWATIVYSTGTRFIDVGLTADTEYQYRSSAIAASDTSVASSAVSGLTSPVAPNGLSATTSSDTEIALAWTAVANATDYRIERSVNGTTWTVLTPGTPLTGASVSYTDNTAAAGTTYYYRITTINGVRSSAASDLVAATSRTAATTLTATPESGTRVSLTWTALPTAFEYVVERSDDSGTTWATIATTSAASYIDDGVTPDTEYVYRVSGTNAGGTGDASADATVTTKLATVTGFTAAASATANSVTLDWTIVANATSYRIDRSTDGTTWSALSTSLTGTDDTFDDTTVAAGTTYYYRVLGENAAGFGAASVTATVLIRPATPTGVTLTATTQSSVTVAWTAVATATGYTVEKSVDSGTTWTSVGTPTGTSIVDTGLATNVTVEYRVKATNATGNSATSSVATITTAPATPAGLAGAFDDTNNEIDLTWTAVTEADSYVIERSVDNGAWAALTPGTPLVGTDAAYSDDDTITPDTSYRYRISATNADGTSVVSGIVTVLSEPAVPTLTAAATSATAVGLSWTTSPTATGYTLQASDDAGTTWATVYTGPNTTYSHTGRTANTDYSYQVLAANATGASEYSVQTDMTTILDVPVNLAGTTPNGTSIVLTWDVSTDATGYKIERSANAGSTWTTVVPGTALVGSDVTYTDTGLAGHTAYQYRLSAVNANGTSAPTSALNVTTRVGVTATLTAAAASATAINLTWIAVPGATTYKIETSTDSGSTWTELATQAGLTYSNSGLTANTSYQYRITAIGSLGSGVAGDSVTGRTLPAVPGSFTAAASNNTSVTLGWTAPAGATGYLVERSANGGTTWVTVVPSPVLTGSATGYTDNGLIAATSYKYRVSAISTVGTGAATSVATVSTRTNAAVVTGTIVSGTQVTLNWAVVPGAASYLVQRSSDAGSTWTASGTPTANTQAVTGLTANTAYLFRVYAVNSSGNSAASNSLPLRTLIAAPTGLATTLVSANEIRLSWNTVTAATGYKLERAIGTGAFAVVTPTTPFTGSSATFNNTTLLPGTVYKYRISATNALGTSAVSSELSVITKAVAPVLTTATQSTTQINLTWPAVASATTYKVELSDDAGTTWSTAATPSSNSYNATGLNADSAYSFRVSSVNASGASVVSNVIATRTRLNAPTGLTVLDTGSTSVTLVWNGSENATSYTLERSANSGTTWVTVVPSPDLIGDDSSYEDVGLTGGTTYQYRLSASNAAGRSANSSVVSGVTMPAAPTVTGTATATTVISLTWTASATATGYRVERSANAGATWTTIASPTGISFSDSGVQAARNYSYRVTALNSAGTGSSSVPIIVSTLLAAPTGLAAATASATAVNLSWTAPSGATGYKIERSTDANTWAVVTQPTALAGTATFFSNTGLAAGTNYYYRITATGTGTIVSPTSQTVRATTTLAAPLGLKVSSVGSTSVNLAWTANTNYNRLSFKVQRSPNGTSGWTTVGTPAGTAVTFSNTGLASATRYFYRLIAVSLAGDSAPSLVVNATTR
ncbi:MAG TPA: fibronectin type III domain-containing protein [Tepidisphaeraceae bacterium]|jgi:titin